MARSKLGSEEHSAAVAGFEALGICQQLAEAAVALGWKEPTSIQQQALPHLLQGAAMLLHQEEDCPRQACARPI